MAWYIADDLAAGPLTSFFHPLLTPFFHVDFPFLIKKIFPFLTLCLSLFDIPTIHTNSMVYQETHEDPASQSDYGESIPLDSLTEKIIQNGAKSDYGDSIPLDPATEYIMQNGVPDIEETPFIKLRNGTLEVSDFTAPRYCELKVSYNS